MKTILRSINTIYHTCSLPIDIFNDEMVKVVLHMAFDAANYGRILIFVTTFPQVSSQDVEPLIETETSFRANIFVSYIEEELLLRTMSLQQYHSPLHDNSDTIDDNDNTSRCWRKSVTTNDVVRVMLLFISQQ